VIRSNGLRTPLLDAAARLADALGVTLDELAGRNESPAEGSPAESKPSPRRKKR
jgi:hypothetical protein